MGEAKHNSRSDNLNPLLGEYDLSTLQPVAHFFGLGTITQYERIAESARRAHYGVQSTEGQYVMRILKELDSGALENEASIQRQLVGTDIITDAMLLSPNDADGYLYSDTIKATVSKRISGEQVTHATPHICGIVGERLGAFHEVVKYLPHNNTAALLRPENVARSVLRTTEPYKDTLLNLLEPTAVLFEADVPSGIMHGDLHGKNMLVDDDRAAIIDMEHAHRGPLIVDIGRSIADMCGSEDGLDTGKVAGYLQGYNQHRTLTAIETKMLMPAVSYGATAVSAWFYEKAGNNEMGDYFSRIASSASATDL